MENVMPKVLLYSMRVVAEKKGSLIFYVIIKIKVGQK